MSKTEAVDGLQGVKFRVFFDLDVVDGEQLQNQLIESLKQKVLVQGVGEEKFRGAQAKFWFDILEDENYSGMGNVIAYIAEVFMKVDKRIELSLPDLQEFIRSEKCRVLYNVIEHQGETINDRIGENQNTFKVKVYDLVCVLNSPKAFIVFQKSDCVTSQLLCLKTILKVSRFSKIFHC